MMSVSGSILQEADFFGVSLLCGCLMVLLYDVLRVFRRLVAHGTVWIAVEDICYWLLCVVFIFAMLYQKNDGLIRGFAIGGIGIGMLFYNHFISPWSIKGIVWLTKKVIALLLFPLRLLNRLTKRPRAFVKRKSLRLLKRGKKLLKKVYKAVRMVISKH